MSPEVFLIALLSTVAIAAVTVTRVARLFANRPRPIPEDVMSRVAELEQAIQSIQQDLGETQERLDFTERLLSAARSERRTP